MVHYTLLTSMFLFLFLQKPIFILYNCDYLPNGLPDVTSIYYNGLVTDIFSSICITIVPAALSLILPRRTSYIARTAYNMVAALSMAIIIVADTALYRHWEFKIDASILQYLSEPKTVLASASAAELALATAGTLVLTFVIYSLLAWSESRIGRKPNKYKLTVLVALSAVAAIIGTTTIKPSMAHYSNNMFLNHAALNPVYNMAYSMMHNNEEDLDGNTEEYSSIHALMFPNKEDGDSACLLLKTQRPDILLIVVESMSAQFVGAICDIPDDTVATELSRLCKQGINFSKTYCCSDRTGRAIVAVLNSIPVTAKTNLKKCVNRAKQLASLPAMLHKAGYDTQAIYSGDVSYLHLDDYFKATGHDKVISKNDFPNSCDISKWGVPDHFAFEWLFNDVMAKHTNGTHPHYTTMLTISSHEPFDVPGFTRHKEKYLNAFAYTDSCIGNFIDRISHTPAWDSLLVIITADHGYNLHTIASPQYAHVPFIMLGGAAKHPMRIDKTVSQLDITGTVLSMLNIDTQEFRFSRNAMSADSDYAFATNLWNNGFTFFDSTGCTIYDKTAHRAIYGNDAERIKKGKVYWNTVIEQQMQLLHKQHDSTSRTKTRGFKKRP